MKEKQDNEGLNEIDILLVEDSDYDAEMTMLSLQENEISNKIHWVKDGKEALDFLLAEGDYEDRIESPLPKLILLDLKMPKVDGLQVLEIIKTKEETKKIPVVMMTSSKEQNDIVKSYELGVNSFIVKPVDFKKFSNAVKEVGKYWMILNQAK